MRTALMLGGWFLVGCLLTYLIGVVIGAVKCWVLRRSVDTKALILVTIILAVLWVGVFIAAQTELRL